MNEPGPPPMSLISDGLEKIKANLRVLQNLNRLIGDFEIFIIIRCLSVSHDQRTIQSLTQTENDPFKDQQNRSTPLEDLGSARTEVGGAQSAPTPQHNPALFWSAFNTFLFLGN